MFITSIINNSIFVTMIKKEQNTNDINKLSSNVRPFSSITKRTIDIYA
jgi:hypothetical protein